jgi:glycosyltransferase involved in cell wall biosynthesis
VLVDLLFWSGTRGGTETYVREIYSRLAGEPDLDLVGFASKEFAADDHGWFPGEIVESGVRAGNRAAWALGETLAVGRAARRIHADVLHIPANIGPGRAPVPTVLTLHDALPFTHPEWVPTPALGGVLRRLIRGAARGARRVLTVSAASAQDIIEVLGVPAERVEVIPLAGSTPVPVEHVGRQSDLLFAPGNRMPHKNVETVLRALALIPSTRRPRLVVTGGRTDDPLTSVVDELGLRDTVVIEGWLSRDDLERTYARATATVLPTRFEGFGLPVLEAMERGCPVICSDLPVLREVAGDAALYADPDSAASFARAIERILDEPGVAETAADAGRERAHAFSWNTAATATAIALRDAAD